MWMFFSYSCGQFVLRIVEGAPPDDMQNALHYAAERLQTYFLLTNDILVNVSYKAMPIGLNAEEVTAACSHPDQTRFPNVKIPAALYAQLTNRRQCPENADAAHLRIAFNANPRYPFYFGTDGRIGSGQADFVWLAMHEILHGLGFQSGFFTPDGRYGYSPSLWLFDKYVFLPDVLTPPVPLFPLPDAAVLTAPLFFRTSRNRSIALFAPDPFVEGTSLSHTVAQTMLYRKLIPGQCLHCVSADLMEVFETLGYAVSPAAAGEPCPNLSSATALSSFLLNW